MNELAQYSGSGIDAELHPVQGVRMAAAAAGIRTPGRLDCALFELAAGTVAAGVFTRNAFCAAPVILSRKHLQAANPRYFLVNAGNANAGTGQAGLEHALTTCRAVTEDAPMPVPVESVLPFSTGVIGEALPVDKILAVMPAVMAGLREDGWLDCARAIMTTDTRPKARSLQMQVGDSAITITGIAKGSGMIKPDMATMLAYIFTDAGIAKNHLEAMLAEAVARSFNRITVDGDTSTNDCCMLAATGASGKTIGPGDREFRAALTGLFVKLAQDLVRDAEGASKFITVRVEEGGNGRECLQLAYAVAESPLVKTALYAADPNWGRILAAVGRAGLPALDVQAVRIYLDEVLIVEKGAAAASYREELGQRVMAQDEIAIRICLGRGQAMEEIWTSDLSHDYVSINAAYRT